jgi:L,D-transpeptidase catalytic domain
MIKHRLMNRRFLVLVSCIFGLLPGVARALDFGPEIIVSVHDQTLALAQNGRVIEKFRISTSKFGVGDDFGSYKTPLGMLWVCNKIGDNLPLGAVIRHRNATGEVLRPNAPGRDPIVTRVIWLKGATNETQNAYARCIYIHGTPQERWLGKPASFGCIRMRSKDVVKVYDAVCIGAHVIISDQRLGAVIKSGRNAASIAAAIAANKVSSPSAPAALAESPKTPQTRIARLAFGQPDSGGEAVNRSDTASHHGLAKSAKKAGS